MKRKKQRLKAAGCLLSVYIGVTLSGNHPPDWAKDAIWYQIFPERFYNGDSQNDPTPESLEGTWPWIKPEWWKIHPWTSDWYRLQPWEKANGLSFHANAQLRRYGGDLQGIIEKLDFLEDLGVNALYLNPIFESSSYHKYNCTMWRHVDNNFGPSPNEDIEIWSREDPADPSTWEWTTADTLFLRLIREVHARDMKIIIDGVFNHVGIPFWAFQDVRRKGPESSFAHWFVIHQYDDPATQEDEFDYQCWFDMKDLPEIREDKNGFIQPVRDFLYFIVSRWMDPNGDGDPSDGIDGWRLDVAERVDMNFWTDFSGWVKDVNPDAYVTGEVWWEDYNNNKMFNAAPWINRGGFDAVMNYRFGDAMYKFFNDEKFQIKASELDQLLTQLRKEYGFETSLVLQNLLDSHDCERLASAVVNADRWIDHANSLQYNPEFKVQKPNDVESQKQKLILTFQFTYMGAPYIYYGDEVGMWGADDPDCRKPMIWPGFNYEDEVTHYCDNSPDCDYRRPRDEVKVNQELLQFYQTLIGLRKQHSALRRGSYRTLFVDDLHDLFAFERRTDNETLRLIFNGSNQVQTVPLKKMLGNQPETWELILGGNGKSSTLKGKSAKIFLKKTAE